MEINKIVPVLETERLILREISPEDTDNIVKWRSNPDVYPYFLSPHLIGKEEHILWYNHKYLKDNHRFDWICIRKDTNESVGIFGMKIRDENREEAEISYLISPDAQGCGFAKEAVTEMIRWCRENGIIHLYAVIHEKNHQSMNFIKSMGFVPSVKHNFFITYKQDCGDNP